MKIKGYQYFCGECRFRTSLLRQSESLAQIEDHYGTKHPGIYPPELMYRVKIKRGLFG